MIVLLQILAVIIFILSIISFGWLVIQLLKISKDNCNFAQMWGIGLLSIALIQLLFALIHFEATQYIVWAISLSVTGLFILKNKAIFRAKKIPLIILLLAILLIITTLSHAPWGSDAYNFWLSKARAFWLDGGVTHQNIYAYWPYDHPLLWPLNITWLYHLLGKSEEFWSAVIPIVSFLAMVLIFTQDLVKNNKWLWTILLVGTPFLMGNVYLGEYVGNADILVALYLLLAIDSIYKKNYLFVGIFLFAGSLTKNDLLPALCIWIILSVLLAFKHRKKTSLMVVVSSVIFLTIILSWKKIYGLSSRYVEQELAILLSQRPLVSNIKYSLMAFREEFRQTYRWGLSWWIILFALITRFKTILINPSHKLVFPIILTQLISYIVIYYVTPEDQATHIATSIYRLVLQIYPAALLLSMRLLTKDNKI